MPTDSIRVQVLQQIETTLRNMQAGADYFTTFALVETVKQNPLTKKEYPQVCIVEDTEEKRTAGTGGGSAPFGFTDALLTLELVFADVDKEDRSLRGNRIMLDLEKCLATLDGQIVAGSRIETLFP